MKYREREDRQKSGETKEPTFFFPSLRMNEGKRKPGISLNVVAYGFPVFYLFYAPPLTNSAKYLVHNVITGGGGT